MSMKKNLICLSFALMLLASTITYKKLLKGRAQARVLARDPTETTILAVEDMFALKTLKI